MKTIDEINAEVDANGYANLTDDEINAFIDWKCSLTTRDAEFQKKLDTYDAQLKIAADAYGKIADTATAKFNALIAKPLQLLGVEDA